AGDALQPRKVSPSLGANHAAIPAGRITAQPRLLSSSFTFSHVRIHSLSVLRSVFACLPTPTPTSSFAALPTKVLATRLKFLPASRMIRLVSVTLTLGP